MISDIDPRSPIPLYEQIAARIRAGIAAGDYAASDALPSVRQLSAQLRVNPATVVQAYRDLEREGFVEMRHGSGTFVRAMAEGRLVDERAKQARELVRRFVAEAGRLGITADEMRQALAEELSAV
jgi:GntR family transcriptional regulator